MLVWYVHLCARPLLAHPLAVVDSQATLFSVHGRRRVCVQGVYFIAVSGALYDVIRGVPPFGYDSRTRKVIVVSPSSGSQYAVEGFMVGGFNIGCAMAALLAALLIPRVRSQSSRALGMAALALVFVFCYMQIIGWYRLKNPWYSVTRLFLG
ncbi:hypothetical protein EON67_04525 [archaeon]|nr:MAG: hypothetical protein EON67_04525 [archaeon]